MAEWPRLAGLGLALCLAGCAVTPAADDEDWKVPPLAPPPPGALDEAVTWARTHTLPLDTLEAGSGFADLQPLKAMIGDARIIGFGEGMHDTHEYLTFRNRLLEFLVVELGVTAIGLETGATEALAADDYVLGRAPASAAAYTSVFSWADTPNQENRQLLDWMRAWNERPTTQRPLRVYGLDLTGGRSGEFTESRAAPDAMLAYIERVDAPRARALREILDPLLPDFNSRTYGKLSNAERNALSAAITDALGAFERKQTAWVAASSAFDYQRAWRQAVVSQQLDMNLRNLDAEGVMSQRDAAMARNAVSALQQEGPQGRLMVFAYVGHIRKGPAHGDDESQGTYLRELVGNQYFAIGSLFNQGVVGEAGVDEWPMALSDPTTLNAALRKGAGRDHFYFDTRKLPAAGPLGDWVERGEPMRHDYFEGRPRQSFDVLVYVDTIGPMHGLP